MKIIMRISSFILLCLIGILIYLLTQCTTFYDETFTTDDGVVILYNEKEKKALIKYCEIKDLYSGCEIHLPAEYSGINIDTLGYSHAKKGGPFEIIVQSDEFEYIETSLMDKNYEIVPMEIKIYLTDNISCINDIDYQKYYIKKDTINIYYKLDYYFIIPEGNSSYYSENGNIFNKSNEEMIYQRWTTFWID